MKPNGKYVNKYTNGSVQATGQHINGQMDDYWEWFRLDGSKMRSGHFNMGKQIGEWITYNRNGEVVKKTEFK